MANEPCAYYKTALPLWLCEFITGFFLLFLFLFYVLRQSRHPKLRGKPRWWTVETALGSSVFLLLLFTAPGFWYSRHARGAPGADALTRTHLAR